MISNPIKKERNHDKQRRIARFEAKRLLMDEIERKKISLVSNENFMQRDYPLRPWARPPKSFKKKMVALGHELSESKRFVKDKQDRYFSRKRAEQQKTAQNERQAVKKTRAMSKEENEMELMAKSLEQLDVVEDRKVKPKNNDFDDLFNL